MIQFADPQLLWLLNFLPFLTVWYIWQHRRQQPVLKISSTEAFAFIKSSPKIWLRHSMFLLRLIAIAALIIAAARPQKVLSKQTIASEGMDVIIAFDVSGSMLTRDYVPNRLEAAKKVTAEFIDKRPNDRIGVVFFAGEAYTGSPITIDHRILKQIILNVNIGAVQDGTAIGMGLGTAVMRLKESRSATKIIILITDGENNAGSVKPLQAAQLAKSLNIRTYCIGILSGGVNEMVTRHDSAYRAIGGPTANLTLMQIAEITGGKYFRASEQANLGLIYNEIDALEKTKVDVTTYKRYEEHFYAFALVGAIALFLELIFRYTLFRATP
jgi:Ca-activated chloride channel family protein